VADELTDAIRTNAQGPQSASGDSGSMQQHALPEVIKADSTHAQVRYAWA